MPNNDPILKLKEYRLNALLHLSFDLIGLFPLILIILAFLDPKISIVTGFVSEYANGNFGWVFNLGVLALGIGSLILSWKFFERKNEYKNSLINILLIFIWGICSFFVAFFVTDTPGSLPTKTGSIHSLAAGISFISITIAVFTLRFSNLRRSFDNIFLRNILDFSVLISLLFFLIGPFEVRGFFERTLILGIVIWLLELNISLRKGLSF